MPVQPLPSNPHPDRLRSTAKDLRNLVRAGVDGAIGLVTEHHPRLHGMEPGSAEALGFKLADAQLTLARHHGFQSWPKLIRCVEQIGQLSRSPHERLGDGSARDADELVRLACLNYGDDSRQRPVKALELWRSAPSLTRASIHAAAAAGDHEAVGQFLAIDPAAADREVGPFGWPPILYATYSRLVTGDPGCDFVETVRALLRHGADANSGFLWHGLLSPFTAITGVIGRGEQGSDPHPEQLPLLRVLLTAGADPNDSQSVYNTGIGSARTVDDTDWLELLLDAGLGRGTNGPWYRRFGDQLAEPAGLVAELLHDAARRGFTERAHLLLAHGTDPNRGGDHPVFAGRTPYRDSVTRGHPGVTSLLLDAGALQDDPPSIDTVVGRCLAGDRLTDAELAAAQAHRPDLVRFACELAKPIDTIRQLVALGWDVNAKRNSTALHEATMHGSLEAVQALLALGADPSITDDGFGATAAGWAEHFGNLELKRVLDAAARPDPDPGSS